ncbi:hypothetical protein RHMOL_Rhmol04G0244100 [Rhododendron molle]|uniref:Uncharacterized protein n=1 Tax=Rhododendron molle TaxID=49168 RepID=A0ACC0P507_RHOML|nr:hypothetical protein RHMOL_Rhmol04G0244100 [Rhododendron molle]
MNLDHGNSAESAHVLQCMTAYYKSFFFTSFGVTLDSELSQRNQGMYTLQIIILQI